MYNSKTFFTAAKVIIYPVLTLVFALSCSGNDEPGPEVWLNVSRSNSYNGSDPAVYLVDTSGNVNLTYTLTLGASPKSVYFILTNTTMGDAGSYPTVKNAGGEDTGESLQSITESEDVQYQADTTGDPERTAQTGKPEITAFNENPFAHVSREESPDTLMRSISLQQPSYDIENVDKTKFYDDSGVEISATCRKVITKSTGNGIPVTLNIWVADDDWESPCDQIYCVNQPMVDALANKFIQAGANNDIYEWITNIFGKEWDTHSYPSQLISDNDEITILLYDIDDDNAISSGVLGFFYSRDNFFRNSNDSVLKYSNQRIMFYLDAVFFARNEGTWEITDEWPGIITSTLAHEFQHMIHFYQKNVLRVPGGSGSETWLNEMCSLVAEDLVANKLGVDGPRGVAYNEETAGTANNVNGRLPLYNYYNYESVAHWYGSTDPRVLRNYSINYAFGAYLARNFGGAKFFQKLVQNSYTNYLAINYAMTKSGISDDFSSVLRKWGAANLLSDELHPAGYYQYNSGTWFTSKINDSDPVELEYQLGSINLYNYQYGFDGPRIYTTMPSGIQAKASNVYYKVGDNLTGTLTRTISMESEIKLTVVVK